MGIIAKQSVKRSLTALALGLGSASCATLDGLMPEERMLSVGCGDFVVIGNVRNDEYNTSNDENDLIGHAWIVATIKVRKVLVGPRMPSSVKVRYFAHVGIREDREFMIVLRMSDQKFYVIDQIRPMAYRPGIAARCR